MDINQYFELKAANRVKITPITSNEADIVTKVFDDTTRSFVESPPEKTFLDGLNYQIQAMELHLNKWKEFRDDVSQACNNLET